MIRKADHFPIDPLNDLPRLDSGLGRGSFVCQAAYDEALGAWRESIQVDAILLPRKGAGKDDLATVRLELLAAVGAQAKVLPFDMTVRDETLPYEDRVALWHDEIADAWQRTLAEVDLSGPVALLVWGDPGLYDSTLRIADRLSPKPKIRVVPGITALQALTAAHTIPFNTIDGSVCVTTGQQLRKKGLPRDVETVFVMLDGKCSFMTLDAPDLLIWWGAFLGMP